MYKTVVVWCWKGQVSRVMRGLEKGIGVQSEPCTHKIVLVSFPQPMCHVLRKKNIPVVTVWVRLLPLSSMCLLLTTFPDQVGEKQRASRGRQSTRGSKTKTVPVTVHIAVPAVHIVLADLVGYQRGRLGSCCKGGG